MVNLKELFGNDKLLLIAGPCVVEGEEMIMDIATQLKELSEKYDVPLIFKSSYKKANRSSLDSFTGIGDLKALKILKKVHDNLDLPVISDIHSVEEVVMAKEYLDVLQIPAFLCRQTELLQAAGMSKKPVFIKKGQFMSPESMNYAVEKVRRSGNEQVALIERGSSFGYGDLVVDFRSIPIMQSFDCPVIMDCTHSVQKPNQSGGVTGGTPAYIEAIAKAAVAVGTNGLFIETHTNPAMAKSDGANMLPLDKMADLLEKLLKIKEAII